MRASPQGWLRDKASLCAYVCKLGLGLREWGFAGPFSLARRLKLHGLLYLEWAKIWIDWLPKLLFLQELWRHGKGNQLLPVKACCQNRDDPQSQHRQPHLSQCCTPKHNHKEGIANADPHVHINSKSKAVQSVRVTVEEAVHKVIVLNLGSSALVRFPHYWLWQNHRLTFINAT